MVGHSIDIALAVAEIKIGHALLVRIAVGPESIETIVEVQRPSGIAVVARAVAGQSLVTPPGLSAVETLPHHHLATCTPKLRTGIGRRDDRHFLAVDPKAAAVVAMSGLGEVTELPFLSGPTRHRVHTGSAVRAGKVVVAGHIIYYRIALVIKIDVLDVAVFAFLMEIPDQSRPLLPEDRKFDNRPVSRGPGLAPILALDEIDVCPGVHAAVDVTVEAAYKLLAVIVGELIVAGLLLPRLDDRGDRLEIRPIDTILAGLEERPADPVVAGVEQKKPFSLS